MIETTLTKAVLSKYLNPYFLETGTANGDCVRLALEVGFKKIFSIELDENLQKENIQKYESFIKEEKVALITGDSLQEIKALISKLDKPTTFWLDAHVDSGPTGIKVCPLYEELEAIKTSSIKTHTILIDDMRILGTGWGTQINLTEIQSRLLEINPKYNFKFENNTVASNDILVAYL
jgi:hypothetical protein